MIPKNRTDLYNQIDEQLIRLKWDNKRFTEYLSSCYRKCSRVFLKDEELSIVAEFLKSLPTPINLKAEIEKEMDRLGWTKTDERSHLESNFGKKFSGQLTQEQLKEFCQFLREQESM
ncbi:MAG: hypothetical protein HC908_01655 [Calothrix sp. SM1_7_51]|nr:hypothetical protein [Calothrix sp. SM1_7_51]